MKDRWTRRELLRDAALLVGLGLAEEVTRRVAGDGGKTVWAEGKLPETLEIRIPKDLVGGWIPESYTDQKRLILKEQKNVFQPEDLATAEMVSWIEFTAEHASNQRAQDCVSMAFTETIRTIGARVTGGEYFKLGVPNQPTETEIDQLHVLNPRAIEATVGSYSMSLWQGVTALNTVGICRNLLSKDYMEGSGLDPLSPEQVVEAARLIPSAIEMVFNTEIDVSAEESLTKMEAAVTEGPVVLAFPWYYSLLDSSGNMDWKDDMCVPREEEVSLTGHAVEIVGYDRNRIGRNGNPGAMLCRFAWGDLFPYAADSDLGITEDARGFVWMPYDFVRFCFRWEKTMESWRVVYGGGSELGFWPAEQEPPKLREIYLPLVRKG